MAFLKHDRRFKNRAFLASLRIIIPLWMAFILFCLIILFVFIPSVKKNLIDQKKETIRELTESTWSLLAEYQQQVERGELTLENAQSRAIQRIRNLRYGPQGKDYFWVNDLRPKLIMHPYFPELEGRDMTDFTDPDGKKIFLAFVDRVKNGDGGYVTYRWQWKDDPGRIMPKTSYVKLFKPWGWVIGTGIYTGDVLHAIDLLLKDLYKILGVLLILILALSLYITWQAIIIEKKRDQAQASLRESEERYRLLAENANDIIWTTDARLQPVYISPSVQRIRGFTPQEALRQPLEENLTPDSLEKVVTVFLDALEKESRGEKISGPVIVEVESYRRDGSTVWLENSVSAIREENGKLSGLLGIGRDLTERKKVEARLRESEAKYRLLVENTRDVIYTLDREGMITFVSPSVILLTDYRPDEVRGRSLLDLVFPDDRPLFADCLAAGADEQESAADLRIIKKDGGNCWVYAATAPIVEEGKVVGLQGTLTDISERKQTEAETRRLEEQLRQAQKMEAIGTLAGGIAHDFNNILAPLVGFSELLIRDLPDDHPFQPNAEIMLSAALRARDLVQQILTFSRKLESEIKPVRIQPIIKEGIKLLRSSIPTNIEIRDHIDPDCGPINADPTKIHQVIINLATNAFHAMEESGGKLTVNLERIRISEKDPALAKLLPGEYALLSVTDTGIGIKKEDLDKIFDPYYTTKETGKGTGLGLSVVHGIVEEFGGHIRINSEPGRGTRVDIFLPLVEADDERQITVQEVTPGGTEHILLVDDEAPVIRMEAEMLSRLGYRVTTRTSSIEAFEAFKANPGRFDLVLTDMAMPNMTGVQLAQRIKAVREAIPIVICTGYRDRINDEKSRALGIQGYLMKPLVLGELAVTLRKVLDFRKPPNPG